MSADVTVSVAETERKYDVRPDAEPADPAVLLGGDVAAAAEDQLLEAVYFDTPDLRLLREGVTLRHRAGGSDAGWHLKLPVGPDTREEVRLPSTRSRQRPPAELARLVRAFSRGAALGRVAQLTTRRRRWLRRDPGGAVLAELVDDRVTALVAGDEARYWREVEVELGEHGSAALLDGIERRLLAAGLQRSASRSKVGRALGGRLPAPAPDRDATAGGVLVAYLRGQVERLHQQDPLVRRDRPDAVHQMRVAARRTRSALQAFGRVLDREATATLVAELRWIAGELGPARDTEVMEARFVEALDGLPAELGLGPVRAALTRTFGGRGVAARARAVAALDGDRYLALLDALDAFLAAPPFTARASRPARRELTRSVAACYERLAALVSAAERAPDRDLALHEARKAAKRLRYAAEVVVPVVGAPARGLQRRLGAVQDLLGTHQDTTVARPVLRELAQGDAGNGFIYGLLYALEAERAAAAERALPAAWRRLRRRHTVGWLGSR